MEHRLLAAAHADGPRRIVGRLRQARARIVAAKVRAGSARRSHEVLRRHRLATARDPAARIGRPPPMLNAALAEADRRGTVAAATGRRRGRPFGCRACLELRHEGTAQLPAG